MDFEDGFELILKAFEKREEEKAWQMWLTLYPNMTKEKFMSFSEYYQKLRQPISTRSTEEILAEVEEIRKALKEGEKVGDI